MSAKLTRPTTGTDEPRRPLGARLWVLRSSGWDSQVTKVWCGTSTRSLVTSRIHSLHCLLGDRLRGEGLGIPSPLLGCHQVRGVQRAPVMDVPVIIRERGGASDSVPRQSAPTSSCSSEACTRSANCAKAGDSTVQFFDVLTVVR